MKSVRRCRCCWSADLLLYLDLGFQPLANDYHHGIRQKVYPLKVLLCKNCYHSQLSVIVNPDILFNNYLYVSGTTKTFRKHCERLAQDAVKRTKSKKVYVLDIACNDGTQLEYFRDLGCKVMGVDPAKNLREITENKNIPVIVDYWTTKTAKKINKRFDILTGTNVFAHVDDVDEFLIACSMVMKKNGILILEFPYANKMIENNEFDTIYHEHLSYFLVNSFVTLVSRMKFTIMDVLQTPIHGGSIRFFLRKDAGEHTRKIDTLIKEEKEKGLLYLPSYIAFSKRILQNKKILKELLKKEKKNGKKIIGYGASAKGNTMLNFFKLHLSYIVDDNSLKWDFYTPGRNISIRSPHILQKEKKNLAIIILSWNFYNEIIRKIRQLRGGHTRDISIIYVPTVKKIPIFDMRDFSISA